jgi:hypothetical protein
LAQLLAVLRRVVVQLVSVADAVVATIRQDVVVAVGLLVARPLVVEPLVAEPLVAEGVQSARRRAQYSHHVAPRAIAHTSANAGVTLSASWHSRHG